MSHEHAQDYRLPALSMEESLGRAGQERIIREALARIDGAEAPAVGIMQASMGVEGQIRLVHDVIRTYLDERDLVDTADWSRRLRSREQAAMTTADVI